MFLSFLKKFSEVCEVGQPIRYVHVGHVTSDSWWYGVWSVRSLVISVFFEDQNDQGPKWPRTELHIKRTDLHMHFGKQTSVSGCMCINCVIVMLDSDISVKATQRLAPTPIQTDAVCSPNTLTDTLRGIELTARANARYSTQLSAAMLCVLWAGIKNKRLQTCC